MHHKPHAIERPDLVAQWYGSMNLPLAPWDITAGKETRLWWRCPKGPDHVWQAKVCGRARIRAPLLFSDSALTQITPFGTVVKSWLAAKATSDWVQ